MAAYAVATRCGSGRWVVAVTEGSPPGGCTPIAGSGNRHCCPESVARSLPGGRNLPTNGEPAQPTPGGDPLQTIWGQAQQFGQQFFGQGGQGQQMFDQFGQPVMQAGQQFVGGALQNGKQGLDVGAVVPGLTQAIDQGLQQGAAAVGQPGAAAAVVEPSWFSRNWPWVLVGGIVVVVGAVAAGTILTSPDKIVPPKRTAPALPPARA